MSVITLTTDFGSNDYYVAVIKGAILSKNNNLPIVDITHNINNFDIVQGAYILKNAYASFPTGSIHLISINNDPVNGKTFLAIRYDNHYFIGPDNGIFSLMFGEITADVFEIEYDKTNPFPLPQLLGKAVQHLSSGLPLAEIGYQVESIIQRISLQAVLSKNEIRGNVIHIDGFQNVILNINREMFQRVGKHRPFQLFYKRNNPISQLSTYYEDVAVGEILCLFNSADHLEIAIHMGQAANLLGLQVGDSVQINFSDD